MREHTRRSAFKADDAARIGSPTAAGDLDEHRTRLLTLRVRESELAQWRAYADANGYSVSELIRVAVTARLHGRS